MPKTYTVSDNTTFQPGRIGAHRAAWLIDTVPNPLAQTGPKLTLNRQGPNGAVVAGAGNGAPVDFTTDDYIYTHGLMNCFAICAAWNKVGNVFTNGYLAHVSSPYGFCAQAINQIPVNAFVVVGIGQGAWGNTVANLVAARGIPHNNIWIYTRAQSGNVGFGVDKYGRFGET